VDKKIKNNSRYCSLHTHSWYSLLDSISSPEDLAKTAKKNGSKGIALTDHGNCFGHVKMQKACKKAGLKFVPGCELYMTHNHDHKNRKSFHLTALAMNQKGLENLYKLVTFANIPVGKHPNAGFYHKPRVSWTELKKFNEGLIILSGCMASILNVAIREQPWNEAIDIAKRFLKIFGRDRFFIELQNVNEEGEIFIKEHEMLLESGRKIAKKLNLKAVATNDSHWITKYDDEFPHEVVKAISSGGTLSTPIADPETGQRGRLVFNGHNYHLMSHEEMLAQGFTKEDSKIRKSCDCP